LIGEHPSILAGLRCAKSLGISYKRWLGWEPNAQDNTEWDDTEREWMLALQTYENAHVCPVCGMDTDFCHDKALVAGVFSGAGVDTCFVGEMREKAMQRYTQSGVVQAPNSQTTRLIAR
jgi:hypothetical protein